MMPPTTIGDYTLGALLGRGGDGDVFEAQHRSLGDPVAVKLLKATYANDPEHRASFVEEAARTREVVHPNVVRVLDFGHDEDSGCCYLVMERLDGESLAAHLRRIGRIPEPQLRELAAQIADGIAAAHARGIVHRDLKPGNVMLHGGRPTIVDFGIAKSLGTSSAAITERRVGTVAYMAPEQLTDGLITPAADVWALGVILYEAATGRLPFSGFAGGRLPQLHESPPRAEPASSALADLIARCLERDPGKRPASIAEVALALRGADGERITEDIGNVRHPSRTLARRARWPRFAIAALALAIIATTAAAMWPRDDAAAPAAPAVTPAVTSQVPADAGVAGVSADAAPAQRATRTVDRPSRPSKPRATKKTTRTGETLD